MGGYSLTLSKRQEPSMIQICRKDKEKVYGAIRTGKIDAAEMSFPNLMDDIILTMKQKGLVDLLPLAIPDKRRDNRHIPFGIVLCSETSKDIARFSVLNGNKQLFASTYLTYLPSEAELLREIDIQKEFYLLQHPEAR